MKRVGGFECITLVEKGRYMVRNRDKIAAASDRAFCALLVAWPDSTLKPASFCSSPASPLIAPM